MRLLVAMGMVRPVAFPPIGIFRSVAFPPIFRRRPENTSAAPPDPLGFAAVAVDHLGPTMQGRRPFTLRACGFGRQSSRVSALLRVTNVMLTKRLRAAAWIVPVVILSTAVALLSMQPPSPLAAAERLVEAVAFHFLGPERQSASDVVVVGITEETLSAFPYRSPVDRAFLASVIDALARSGVVAIGLDIVLDRPTEPSKDAALRRALTRTDPPVVAISVAPDTIMSVGQRRFLAGFLDGVRTGDANLARDRFDDTVRDHVPMHPSTGQPSFPAAIAAALGVAVPERPFRIEWRRSRGRAGPDVPTYPADRSPCCRRAG